MSAPGSRLWQAHGVKVIDYDRLTLGGRRPYYVSFNNVPVGQAHGPGLRQVRGRLEGQPSERGRHARRPDRQQRHAVLQGLLRSPVAVVQVRQVHRRGEPCRNVDPPTAQTEFEQAFTAHTNINSALIPNDENGAPIITYLKSQGIKPKTFPTTGQDATLTGLQNILSGYQCGTVYKPIYWRPRPPSRWPCTSGPASPRRRAWSTAARRTARSTRSVPSVSRARVGDPAEHESTIIKDNFVPASQLCAGSYAADCKKAGVSS